MVKVDHLAQRLESNGAMGVVEHRTTLGTSDACGRDRGPNVDVHSVCVHVAEMQATDEPLTPW